jgi:6-phosphofructokinase 2
MAAFLTLTMNPALDVFAGVERVAPDHKLRCGAPHYHPGGGGINVARVLHRLGADVLALHTCGGVSGTRVGELLRAEGVPAHAITIAGDTRESFSVHEAASGHDFRFVLPGPALSAGEWQACLRAVESHLPAQSIVASGSLPPGVPQDFLAQLARTARARGSRLVVDASGPPLVAALDEGVHLVKPSLRELAEFSGRALDTPAQQRDVCDGLVRSGAAEIVALSLGGEGALLVTAQGAWRAAALQVPVESTIGAGDSFLAALLWALSRGDAPPDALRHAIAAGAAALRTPGTALCDPAEVKRLATAVQVSAA